MKRRFALALVPLALVLGPLCAPAGAAPATSATPLSFNPIFCYGNSHYNIMVCIP